MKVELLVSEWCPTCPQAEAVWRAAAGEKAIDFAVVDMGQPEGRALAHRLRIRTIHATVIDGELKAVGVPSLGEARGWIAAAPERKQSAARHAGLLLATDSRAHIVSAMIWLVLSGAALLAHGGLLADGTPRPLVMHAFGVGFALLLVLGLGAHMLPRFTGQPIVGGAWPWLQLAAVHGGLVLSALGAVAGASHTALLGAGLPWLALLIFTVRVWPVLWPRSAMH